MVSDLTRRKSFMSTVSWILNPRPWNFNFAYAPLKALNPVPAFFTFLLVLNYILIKIPILFAGPLK